MLAINQVVLINYEGIILGAHEELDEVAGGASRMDDCEHERE